MKNGCAFSVPTLVSGVGPGPWISGRMVFRPGEKALGPCFPVAVVVVVVAVEIARQDVKCVFSPGKTHLDLVLFSR